MNNIFTEKYYLTDGGLETTLIFLEGVELTHFAAFELLNNDEGRQKLRKYYNDYVNVAKKHELGFVFETPTWRANPDWGYLLGYSSPDLDSINQGSVKFLRDLVQEMNIKQDAIISGNIGPRGDGYIAEKLMTAEEAKAYHLPQIKSFKEAGADIVSAMTINYSDEAVGIVMAAKELNIPVVISFTVETDGKLPNGESLKDAIQKVDALTRSYATHFMINCAHPEHFRNILEEEAVWKSRIKGIRANASLKSHAELNESDTLDTGDKPLLAKGYMELKKLLPQLNIIGGCCGTDHTHMEAVCEKMFKKEYENSR